MQALQERLSSLSTPNRAVADAMMVVQARQFVGFIPPPFLLSMAPEKRAQEVEKIWEKKTRGQCAVACENAICFLGVKYRDLFDALVIIEGRNGVNQPHRLKWREHQFFLAKDKEGVWYAASPANYEADSSINRLTRIISSINLSEVIDTIENEEGGIWPTAEFIEETVLSDKYSLPALNMNYGHLPFLTGLKIGVEKDFSQEAIPLYLGPPLSHWIRD